MRTFQAVGRMTTAWKSPNSCGTSETPSNPYDLPAMLSFRDGTGYAQAVFLTDLTLQDGFSSYVMSVTGIAVANYVRLDVERLFGRMVAVHRFFLELTWTEPSHDLNLMAECAIKLTNYLARMPVTNDRRHVHDAKCHHDPTHTCTVWCVHNGHGHCEDRLGTGVPATVLAKGVLRELRMLSRDRAKACRLRLQQERRLDEPPFDGEEGQVAQHQLGLD